MAETIVFEKYGILITPQRVVVGSTTYAMNNVTSVRVYHEPDPSMTGPKGLRVLAVLFVLEAAILPFIPGLPLEARIGPLPVALATWWLAGRWQRSRIMNRKSYASIMLPGEAHVFTSFSREEADEVGAALNDAIVARG